MNRLLLILILMFSFQTLAKADDIRDFEIEGMSIGDSLLDFYNQDEIKEMYITTYPKSKKYIKLGFRGNSKLNDYEHVTFHVRENDNRYIIHTINGVMFFENKLDKCLKKKKEIVKDLSNTLTSLKPYDYEYSYQNAEKGSIAYITDFKLNDGSSVRVWCVNWTTYVEENKNYNDSLSISMSPKYFLDWLNNESQ
jgi:hypothetical protein